MKSFQQLRELQRIIGNFGSKSSKSLFSQKAKKSQLSQLAHKIADPGDRNEQAWASEICGTDAHDQTYLRLRSYLKRRLLGQLFHLDIRTGSEYRKAIYRSAQDVFCIRMLVMFGARNLGMWLIPRALERARKYELTQDHIELLILLRQDATINGYKKKFAHYAKELDRSVSLRSTEMTMQAMNGQISVEIVGKAQVSERAKVLAMAARPKAAVLFREHPTFNVGLSYYRIASLATESADDSRKLFQVCDEAEKFLDRFPHLNSPLYTGQFAVKRLSSAIAIQDFAGAREAVASCERSFPSTTNNWFIWKESEMHLLLHTQQWQDAAALHTRIVGHERFPVQPEQVRQKWTLLGNYVIFASGVQGIVVSAAQQRGLSHALQEVPIYKKDKVGYNASLFILQYLILASRGDYDGLIKKSEAIGKYVIRHLRDSRQTPLYGFLKTLVLLNKYDYDLERVRKRAHRFIEQFHRFGRETVDETQTLRFDMMWEWIAGWVESTAGAKLSGVKHSKNLLKNANSQNRTIIYGKKQ
jgi:hypothetical protein